MSETKNTQDQRRLRRPLHMAETDRSLRDELSAASSDDRRSVTVTEAERAALERAIASFDASDYPDANRDAETLRSLLADCKEDCEVRHE